MLMIAENGEVIAIVRRHQDIADVFRMMKERLGLTNEFCDDVGGLTKGHTDKILGPSEQKNWGPTTFDLFCEMFAVEFRVHIDLDAAKRMEAVWEGRKRPLAMPDGKARRISQKLIERAKPHVLREIGRAGGLKSSSLPTARQVAQKGGKSRAKKLSKQRRSEIARIAGLASAAKRRCAVALLASVEVAESLVSDAPQLCLAGPA